MVWMPASQSRRSSPVSDTTAEPFDGRKLSSGSWISLADSGGFDGLSQSRSGVGGMPVVNLLCSMSVRAAAHDSGRRLGLNIWSRERARQYSFLAGETWPLRKIMAAVGIEAIVAGSLNASQTLVMCGCSE